MSSSKLLEQAIVDAQALRDSAYKSAQASLVEKFAPQIKEAVEKLLEQEPAEDPTQMGALAGPTDFGGAPEDPSDKSFVAGAAKDIPLAATDGEKLCPCPDDDETVTLEIDLAKLADELSVGKDDEEDEDINMQPMMAGMQDQPSPGAGLQESLEIDEEILEEELEEEISLEETEVSEEVLEEDDLEEVKKIKNKTSKLKNKKAADINDDGKLSPYEEKRGQAIEKAMGMQKKNTNESTVKQLLSTSAQLLKEHQNTVKLVEKKDSQIQKLLEENKKFSSIIEEMSEAFKKLDEVNLLNARLFYQNQVLKSASLNERQKTHIVEAVSKADSVNEAKAVYETLINSVGGATKEERSPKSLNEAISKKSSFRLPHKQAEQLNDPNKDRWLKLAGIK